MKKLARQFRRFYKEQRINNERFKFLFDKDELDHLPNMADRFRATVPPTDPSSERVVDNSNQDVSKAQRCEREEFRKELNRDGYMSVAKMPGSSDGQTIKPGELLMSGQIPQHLSPASKLKPHF